MTMMSPNPFRLPQLVLRALILAASTVLLAIHSYFLAALASHSLSTPTNVRAAEGISGSAVLYALVALVLLFFSPASLRRTESETGTRHPAVSLAALVLNLAFASAFIFVAVANEDGTGSCSGDGVKTVFGEGKAGAKAKGENGGAFTALPTFGDACRMHKACLATAIVGIFLFLFNLAVELAFIRHRRSARPRPGHEVGDQDADGQVPVTGGSGQAKGFFARIFSGRKTEYNHPIVDGNMLPQHTTPNDLSYGGSGSGGGGGGAEMTMNQHTSGRDTASLLRPSSPSRNHSYDPDYLPLAPDNTHHVQEVGYPSHSPYHEQGPPSGYRYDDGVYDRV